MRPGSLFSAATLSGLVLSSCSGPPAQDVTSPSAANFVQDRDADPTGRRIAVTMTEVVTEASAEVPGLYTVTGGINVLAATLRSSGDVIDLDLDATALPGSNTVSVSGGIEDLAGNVSDPVSLQPITSTDTEAPEAASIAATTISGASNDQISVLFDDDMVEVEVEAIGSWVVESPLGDPLDLTGATVDYDRMTRRATVTLNGAGVAQNICTFDEVHASFTTMRDIAGNVIAATAMGSTAINTVAVGDAVAPSLLSAVPGPGNTLILTFTEDVQGVETLDLQTAPNPNGTEITLTDASDLGLRAGGTVELTGIPADGDSLTISDGVTAVTFEFDFASGSIALSGVPLDTDSISIHDGSTLTTFEFDNNAAVGGGNVSVAIGADAPATIVNLIAAINADPLAVTASAGMTSSEAALTNDGTGVVGNVAISTNDLAGVQTAAGMSGGGIAGDTAVPVDQTSVANTVQSLMGLIDGNAFGITTTPGAFTSIFALENGTPGVLGNVALQESDANGVIQPIGMAGGTAPGTRQFEPTASSAVGTSLQATVTYLVPPAASDVLRLYGVTDLAGNQLTPELGYGVTVASAVEPGLSNGNSSLTAATGEANDTLEVRFDSPVHPFGAMDLAHYSLEVGGGVLDLSSAVIDLTMPDRASIAFGAASGINLDVGETYTLVIDGLRSHQGILQASADVEVGLTVAGDVAPPGLSAARLDPANSSAVFVEFNEPVDVDGATSTASYTLAGNATVSADMVHPRVVRVALTAPLAVSEMLDVSVAALTDLAGNQAGGIGSIAITAADLAAPSVTSIAASTAELPHIITVTFDEAVDLMAATSSANYSMQLVGGPVVSLTGAEFTTKSTSNQVVISLADGTYLDTDETLSLTVDGVRDVAGNQLVPLPTTSGIIGDGTPPSSVSGFINLKQDPARETVQVEFSEAMDSTMTLPLGNWLGSGGQVAAEVARRSSTVYTVTFDAPIGPADTVDVSAPTDAAGNVGVTISFDPVE